MESTDKSLLDAHIRGDAGAFEQIVRRYGDAVLGYLTRMTSDRELAEDLFQETFKKVHEKARSFAGGSFKSWLFTIANRLVIDSYRRRSRMATVSLNQGNCPDGEHCADVGATLEAPSDEPLGDAIRAEQAVQVRRAVEALPAKQRATLILAYYQQLSYAEVAEVMQCSVGTVKRQMYRALHSLQARLPDRVEVS